MGILKGLKVLDFSTLLPGPFATMMLADMGAEIIKVESPSREDLVKHLEPIDDDISAAFAHLNRSKRSLSLDLKQEEAKEVIYQLIQEYDIVVEQFRPGVMDKLGIGYDKLKEINPKIIFCSITGYGQTGPLKNRAGHDINYLSLSGVSSYSFRRNQVPVPAGVQVADIAGGSMPAVIGILAAVYHRNQTGEGQHIDVSITDVSFSLNAMYGSGYLVAEMEPEPESLLLNGGYFYDYYETKDNRYFSIASIEPKFQIMLCDLMGDKSLIQLSSSQRMEDQHAFKAKLRETFKQKTFNEWLTALGDDFDGCIEPVLHFSESVNHPQIKEREMVVSIPKKQGGVQKQIAFPIKFSKEQAKYQFTGVPTGYHSQEILEELGLDNGTILKLTQKEITKK